MALRRPTPAPPFNDSGPGPDPYVDYSRRLTQEGGILITYKDIDRRIWCVVWRAFLFIAYTGVEYRLLALHTPVQAGWINALCLLAVAAVNLLIVWKPPELYRGIEIRSDCLILEGRDVFWTRLMENGWPELQWEDKENATLAGVYGARFVEYLKVRRFDEYDRAPEVLAAHLQDAMKQLWEPALFAGQAPKGS